MKLNAAKKALAAGGLTVGSFMVEFRSSGIPRLLAGAGAELAIYDQEHTGWSTDSLRPILAASHAAGVVPVVRVPAPEKHLISAVLDAGSMGVMVPMVDSAEQACAIVAAAAYPPRGARGLGPLYPDEFDDDLLSTLERIDREQLVIAMIETAAGLANVDEIAAVEGIDVLWVGHFDLTNALGIPGQFDHSRYGAALDRIQAATEAHGKALGMMAMSAEEGEDFARRGVRCICFGDTSLYLPALRDALNRTSLAAAHATGGEPQPSS